MNFSAQDTEIYIAAGSCLTPVSELMRFFLHSDCRIRARVAENLCTPKEWLWELSSDESTTVRIAVAENPFTPLALKEMLALDSHDDVRFAIAENANTLPHLLRILIHDDNPYVAKRARQTLQRIECEKSANAMLNRIDSRKSGEHHSCYPVRQKLPM